jgi:hypothetical protein
LTKLLDEKIINEAFPHLKKNFEILKIKKMTMKKFQLKSSAKPPSKDILIRKVLKHLSKKRFKFRIFLFSFLLNNLFANELF